MAQSRLIRHFYRGKAGLLDWQAVRRGHPSRELAYTLITSLTPEDRRATQHDLLDDYRRALAAAGGPDLDRDDLRLRYRQGALYGYVAPLITAGVGECRSKTSPWEVCGAALQRLTTWKPSRR